MWLFYASICFVFINAALASILGITAFQLASTFMLILQLTSGTSASSSLMGRNHDLIILIRCSFVLVAGGAMLSEYLMNEYAMAPFLASTSRGRR
jgi:hypothetical protein